MLRSRRATRCCSHWRAELEPELIVIEKRLDHKAPSVTAEQAHALFVGSPAMMTRIDIPSTGHWEIAAKYRGKKLSFVISVQP